MAGTAQPSQIADIGEMIDRKSRLGQMVHWLKGGRGSPLIIFDECHKVAHRLLTVLHTKSKWPCFTRKFASCSLGGTHAYLGCVNGELPGAKTLVSDASQLAYRRRWYMQCQLQLMPASCCRPHTFS